MLKTAIAAALALTSTPVLAQDGAWQVGDSQIHIVDRSIDTRTATGRATLLAQVERAAAKLCRDVRLRGDQKACVADTVRIAARSVGGRPVALALSERDSTRLAAR